LGIYRSDEKREALVALCNHRQPYRLYLSALGIISHSRIFESIVARDEPTGEDQQSPERLRAHAAEIRATANAMGSPELRERMLQIALKYDNLADWAERMIAESRPDGQAKC
jgi:hypothetical protein